MKIEELIADVPEETWDLARRIYSAGIKAGLREARRRNKLEYPFKCRPRNIKAPHPSRPQDISGPALLGKINGFMNVHKMPLIIFVQMTGYGAAWIYALQDRGIYPNDNVVQGVLEFMEKYLPIKSDPCQLNK